MYKEILTDLFIRLSSRKFLVFGAIALIIFADNFGLKLDPEIRNALMIMSISYITAEGAIDAVKAYKS